MEASRLNTQQQSLLKAEKKGYIQLASILRTFLASGHRLTMRYICCFQIATSDSALGVSQCSALFGCFSGCSTSQLLLLLTAAALCSC
jgi:hypothetical protein